MYSKDRQPPRFVPTLTEVVAEKANDTVLNVPSLDQSGESLTRAARPVDCTDSADAWVTDEGLSSTLSSTVAALGQGIYAAQQVPAVPAASESWQSDWMLVCAQVQLEVQNRLPQLLEPLWQKFQQDAVQVIQTCVQQTLAQKVASAQREQHDTKR